MLEEGPRHVEPTSAFVYLIELPQVPSSELMYAADVLNISAGNYFRDDVVVPFTYLKMLLGVRLFCWEGLQAV